METRTPPKLDLRKVQNPLSLGVHKPPTRQHTAAVWECMLGTVYAANRAGEVRYFDYDYRAALKFADLKGCDLRTYRQGRWNRPQFRTGVQGREGPGGGQLILWRRVES